MTNQDAVADHYAVSDLGERILAALANAGVDVGSLTVHDLAPVDEFHIRGRTATEELTEWANITSDDLVLDVGCGVGGTCRYLASTCGCRTWGVDLTPEYCRAAEMLSARVGLHGRTAFQKGSALQLPFPDKHFDVVWTEHVQMNIADKAGFYGEVARVLRPGGRFAFHDILAGKKTGLRLPVPWASNESMSDLIAQVDLRELLGDLGFEAQRWEDKTQASVEFFENIFERNRTQGPPPVGLHLLMGDEAGLKFQNVLRNLEEEHICVVQAVMNRDS